MPRSGTSLESSVLNARRALEKGTHFDAIVVGAGASGGLAAALLCEAGLTTLVLDAGYPQPFWRRPYQRALSLSLASISTPRVTAMLPPGVVWRGERLLRSLGRRRQSMQTHCYAWPSAPEQFVDDVDNPYETPEDRPFMWLRTHGLGGRVAVPLHGRQYLRHNVHDFRATDGKTPHWPFEPHALDPFYDLVERRLGLSGRAEHSRWLPNSIITHNREPDHAEQLIMARIADRYEGVSPVLGRYAPPLDAVGDAARTGKLLLRRGAIAAAVEPGAANGTNLVRFFDRETGAFRTARSKLVMLGAGSLESTRILLNSASDRFPGGIGARSGMLGANVMDHVGAKAQGTGPDLGAPAGNDVAGKCIYLPRFDTREGGETADARGYGARLYCSPAIGGQSYFTAIADAEMFPRQTNRLTLSKKKDAWGIPILHIDVSYSDEERAIARKSADALEELADVLGVKLNGPVSWQGTPGNSIHEVGSARMGDDPALSVLDPFSQCWDAPGLYVIDGAAFPSEGNQNPTLTIMALTARACDHVLQEHAR